MKALFNFLFGKSAKIFDENGNVLHQHPKSKWEAWNKRYFSDPGMNWRNHNGTKAKIKK